MESMEPPNCPHPVPWPCLWAGGFEGIEAWVDHTSDISLAATCQTSSQPCSHAAVKPAALLFSPRPSRWSCCEGSCITSKSPGWCIIIPEAVDSPLTSTKLPRTEVKSAKRKDDFERVRRYETIWDDMRRYETIKEPLKSLFFTAASADGIILPRADQLSSHPEPSALHWRAGHPPCSTTFNTRVPYCACLSFGKQICFILMILMRQCLYCLGLQTIISVLVNRANINGLGLGLGCVGMVSYPSLGRLVLAWTLPSCDTVIAPAGCERMAKTCSTWRISTDLTRMGVLC